MFESSGCLKIAEEDDFEKGCGIKGAYSICIDYPISGKTLDEIKQKCLDFACADENSIEVDVCDEPGRIDVQVMENENGQIPSEHEYEAFRLGKYKLWCVTYSWIFDEVTRAPAKF